MIVNEKILATFLILISLGVNPSLIRDPDDFVNEASNELICTCGCGKLVNDCYCDTAKNFKVEIEESVAAGMTTKQIIQKFYERYGETVLATPKKSGLELTIWTLPIIASIFGTVVIFRYASKKARIPDSDVDLTILEGSPTQKKVDVSLVIEGYDLLLQEELEKVKKSKK
jgi:cytochrome c-type biogenesis protein CcmH